MLERADIDHVVWDRFLQGDKAAYAAIYRHYYPRLYHYGVKFCEDVSRTQDGIQEVFTWCWLHRERLAEVHSPGAYLFVSLRHTLSRARGPAAASAFVPLSESAFPLQLARDETWMDEERSDEKQAFLQKALDTLTPRQREAIFLRFYEGLSYEEIAPVLGISLKAAYKLLGRAIGELRHYSSRYPVLQTLLYVAWTCAVLGCSFPR